MKESIWQKRLRISADLKAKVRTLLAQGMSQSDISRKVGVTRQRVQQIVKEFS